MSPVKVNHRLLGCGKFGAIRKHDVHTGLDLYCEEGANVSSTSDGIVIDVFQFTGEVVGSPWWNDTHAVVIRTGSQILVYGEINPFVVKGELVCKGQTLGRVTSVLRVNKGVTPTSMLHLEVWEERGYIKNFTWKKGEEKPDGLLDPISVLTKWLIKTSHGYILEDYSGRYEKYFTMACDSKAWLMSENSSYTYLTRKADKVKIDEYKQVTGKTLWWESKESY